MVIDATRVGWSEPEGVTEILLLAPVWIPLPLARALWPREEAQELLPRDHRHGAARHAHAGVPVGRVHMKHSSRRHGYLSSKLTMIQEEIEKANRGQDPDFSDDPEAEAAVISEDQ